MGLMCVGKSRPLDIRSFLSDIGRWRQLNTSIGPSLERPQTALVGQSTRRTCEIHDFDGIGPFLMVRGQLELIPQSRA